MINEDGGTNPQVEPVFAQAESYDKETPLKADEADVEAGEVVVDEKDEDDVEEEELWGSRWSFILASVGSAIGLGNFWRFPFIMFRYGADFLIPYVIALVFVGIPLMQLEMAIGQVFRCAATQAFGKLDPRFRGIGLAAASISFGIVTYYMVVIGWGNVYWCQSWYADMPWSIYNKTGDDVLDVPVNHFFGNTLRLVAPDLHATRVIVSSVFAGALFIWACVYLILWSGTEFISKAVWLTVLLPVFTLIILVIVGATLDGAGEGVKEYIANWDFSNLNDGNMWTDAFGQIFFSLSLSTGVMTAYASMNPRNADIVKDAMIVSVLNCCFSFIAGFAVFTVAGYLSVESGLSFDDEAFVKNLQGPRLAFVAYPSGLSLVSDGAGANVLTIIFFTTFFFLGVDSAFSLVEAVVLNFRETKLFGKYDKVTFTSFVCTVGFVLTIAYCSDIGLYLLDVVDDYVSGLGLLIIGFLESFVAGWVYNRKGVVEKVGSTALAAFEIGVGGGFSMFTALSLGLGYKGEMEQSAVFGTAFGVGLAMMAIGIVVSYVLAKKQTDSPLYYLFVYGPDSLRIELNKTITENGSNKNWELSMVWAIMLKYVMTPTMMFLMCQRIAIRWKDGGYAPSDYDGAFQSVGAVPLAAIVAIFLAGVFFPKLYEI